MAENSMDPLTGLPGQVESLREENTRLRAENKTLKDKASVYDELKGLTAILSPFPDLGEK
jgi:regulator of replication initiation timing